MRAQISIILPVYNVEKYIEESLKSIICQTIGVDNLEVIMVNDGSTDGSGRIMDEYATKYNNFRAIHFDKCSGAAGRPRNVGIENASGEYIMFLDPDDLYTKDACKILYDLAKEYNSDMVVGTYEQFTNRKTWNQPTFETRLTKELININIEDNLDLIIAPPAIWSKIIKTDIIKNNNILFPEGVACQDAVFAAETLLVAKKISFTSKIVCRYRIREDQKNLSITQNVNSKYFDDFNTTRQLIIGVYEKYKKVDYYDVRYLPDLKFFFDKLGSTQELQKYQRIKILDNLHWFIIKSREYNKFPNNKYDRNIMILINNKKYDQALNLIDKKKSKIFELKEKIKNNIRKISNKTLKNSGDAYEVKN